MSFAPTKPSIITLTTDFGTSDSYVAQMKGVILSINANVRIVDISHDVRPQQVLQATYLTQTAWPYFPPGAVHLAVVDPGVGSDRLPIVLHTKQGVYVGPDNGVLSAALPDEARPATCSTILLPVGVRAFAITDRRFMRERVSVTFHGRDIFAPAAAHLSLGVNVGELGEAIDGLVAMPSVRAERVADGSMQAQVIHIDRFGNVITSIRWEDLAAGQFSLQIGGQSVPGPFETYAQLQGLGALAGSSGYLEIAVPNGSAVEALGVEIGARVRLEPERSFS
ncbi:MAG: SAM-dependent chlorinase/fluorinase [Chloroflexi bacterium]|nr:SAM-dependent chlorinase/fluorinase [Chloroflexota bacterium]MCI0855189.1 SAM-dependent chlorinase/fluorinase [Chloroflexota bacterium]MCI0889169.1 SAM-dependent chlorinase/fluorinase [Chloroflexota bacterium]